MTSRTSTLFVVLISVAAGMAVWAVLRFTAPHSLFRASPATDNSSNSAVPTADRWEQAIAKVKENRGEVAGATPIDIPPELQHYTERRWFLGTQVAEVRRHNLATFQDFLDLAAKLQSGELVGVPTVTDTYVLFGVGQIANDGPLSRYDNNRNVELYNERQLREEFAQIDAKRTSLTTEISSLNRQIAGLNRRERARRAELQKQLAMRQQDLRSSEEDKALLDELYGRSDNRQRLFREYEALQTLAKDFRGRTFNLENPADRQALKVTLLSSLRPQAFKLMEEIAAAYHAQFNRPLPVSSLVRPEQYQHALRKVNRSAAVIETPPHSTGLAFDIDYRYMSSAEQNFVMTELARLKQAGRIEVLRERSANYHVFVFRDGTRPSDELIAASLDEVGEPATETHHAAKKSSGAKSSRAKSKSVKHKSNRQRSNRPKAAPKRRRR